MKRRIVETGDGSKTILLEDWQEQYHSLHGAIREAYHVFLENGLFAMQTKDLSVLEIGFGTGLNAIITLLEAQKRDLKIHYTGLEAYPVKGEELDQLNYVELLGDVDLNSLFRKIHDVSWNEEHAITPFFALTKILQDFRDFAETSSYSLIYFDAFGPRVQPELWTVDVFNTMFEALLPAGILVTYSAKGSVRRAMLEAGFDVEKLPGPPGKREMLRAVKPPIS